ncbi:CAP domain-containing protein [Noviherbaspirillum sp. DKR-6]|uniref:CAP domain-containing protein n=2 Tax=Noviherbaspirillum pedocola TaxID=2801341 RepID=A0A934T3F1_9BURK|nr:CAP domain-containing protein [Noviherbaspirillum pedocola]
MMNRINAARASGRTCGTTWYGPAPALSWNAVLFNAAAAHSTDMAANNYFSHTGLNGSDPGQRITGAGYAWSAYGENIAAGQTSVQSVVDGWLNSPGHCANLMNPQLVDVGVSCVSSNTSNYPTYWTMDLARPR